MKLTKKNRLNFKTPRKMFHLECEKAVRARRFDANEFREVLETINLKNHDEYKHYLLWQT
jgi:hypothetical protein